MAARAPGGVADPLRHFLDVTRTMGVARALRLTPGWLLSRRYMVAAWSFRRRPPPVAALPGASWNVLEPADWPQLREVNPSLSTNELDRRQAEGQECLVARIGGETVGYYRW
jgi:hypothetical protein